MTEIEMLKNQLLIAQNENARLREMIKSKRPGIQKSRDVFPDTVLKKFPLVYSAIKRPNPSYKEYQINSTFAANLSNVIRHTVFGDTKRKKSSKGRSYISVQEMNDGEYSFWLEMVGDVLSVLESGCRRRLEMLEGETKREETDN